ncbi:MAG: V-type ATP synthase subunit I [Thermoplasmata archaeon]|nr:V-type ATP synthase subunit I [Thermoplasmata archaeon]
MIKPERMSRIAIVGPRKKLDTVIHSLYELNLFHVVDFVEEDPDVKIGSPLEKASEVSQKLLKLRSIIRSLHLEDFKPESKVKVEEIEKSIDQVIVTLDLEVSDKMENRQTLSSRIRELETHNEILDEIREFGLPLDCYFGYDSLSVFTGTVEESVRDEIITLQMPVEVIQKPYEDGYLVAIFCKKQNLEKIRDILNENGYQEILSPCQSGDSGKCISSNEKEIGKLRESLDRADKSIESLRKKYGALLLAAEEHYSIEVRKAETPLRIAATAHSFVIDGWVPKSSYEALKESIGSNAGDAVTIEDLSVTREQENEAAPVKLRNNRLARPFEMFVELMSTPLYNEFDPTFLVFLVFPLFFGLMIGDAGYGFCLILAGWVFYAKLGRDSKSLRTLGLIIIAGGIFAAFFGLFLFGEAFGLPFHPPIENPAEPSWEFLFNYPLHPIMEKLIDVKEFLVISIVAAWMHMGFGYIIGFFNELHHDRKQAMMKIFWFLILNGMFIQMLFVARWTVVGGFFFDIIAAPFESMVMPFAGMNLSFVAIGLIVTGIAGFFVVHGAGAAMELMEVLSLLANIVSYTRLAAIGVAKGAMALAFNTIVIDNFFHGGNVILIILGAVVLIVLQLLVFALGSLSSGIQAIRLNYVEFFLKFFKGGGVSFEPLGYERKYSEKSEV